jgi:hypothetical protein
VVSVIFVSYAREDGDRARDIVQALTKRGYKVWFDKETLLPGQKWKPTIERAIREASVFLAVLSHRAVSKQGFVQREMKAALEVLEEMPEDGIFVIPLRLDDCEVTDSRLRELHYVDLFPDFESGIDKVMQAMVAAKVPCSHLTNLNDVPRISLLSVEPTHINEGDQTSEDAEPKPFAVGNEALSPEPVIESVILSSLRVAAGDSLSVTIRAKSKAPVNWLNKKLTGPVKTLYDGGSGTQFTQERPDIWVHTWVQKFSPWAPPGQYLLSGISVGNEAQLESEPWPDIPFEVVKVKT